VMLRGGVSAGQASRTTLLAEGAAAVAGDVAETGASFKNEIEAAIAIRFCPALRLSNCPALRLSNCRRLHLMRIFCPTSNNDVNDNNNDKREKIEGTLSKQVSRMVTITCMFHIRLFAW